MPGGNTSRFGVTPVTPAERLALARNYILTGLNGSPLTSWLSDERKNHLADIMAPLYAGPGHSGHQFDVAPFGRGSSPVLVVGRYLTEEEILQYRYINEQSKSRSPLEGFVRGFFGVLSSGVSELFFKAKDISEGRSTQKAIEQIGREAQSLAERSQAMADKDVLAESVAAKAPDSVSTLSELNQKENSLRDLLLMERTAKEPATNWTPAIAFAVVLLLFLLLGGKRK